ncbi:MAG: L,D-transpeptidase family protein [Rhodocyclaceae bacterium]|nr:L,D-transpeptidase family protein [Rhodocyclaceae bacterium]
MTAHPAIAQKSALAGRCQPLFLLLACLAGMLFAGISHANPLMDGLEAALPHYRQIAADPLVQAAWQEPLPPLGSRKLEPGKPYAGLPLLMRRLVALSDLPSDTPIPERYEYEGQAIEGIIAFQRRHGLEPDGVIGKETLVQLNVPPSVRVRQIELNIARLKQLPSSPRLLIVNVPEFMLRAYEQAEEKLRMKIIVGNALRTRTPMFVEDMRYIEFSPYWNVPPSIARKETIPKLRRDPQYFEAQGFEFYTGNGSVVTTLADENLEAVLQGQMRIRQRPGAKNALGGIKFVFPNNDNIYMHHTPAIQLFKKARRDFSHGCIRVEEPLALALFVLRNEPGWDEERILAAMAKGRSATLRLREPLPVLIAYFTAVAEEDGRVHFFPDLYGFDKLQ